MNKTEQGVQRLDEMKNSLIHILLLAVFCLANTAFAETPSHDTNIQKHHVFIIH